MPSDNTSFFDDAYRPQLREFAVNYTLENLIQKARIYYVQFDSLHLNYSSNLDQLTQVNQQLMVAEKNQAIDQLLVKLATWPKHLSPEAFTLWINTCIEHWISAVNQGTAISSLFNAMKAIEITNQSELTNHSFQLFLHDLITETLYLHQTYQVTYLLDHDALTHLPNTNVLIKNIQDLTENNNEFSLLSIRFIIERGATTISPIIPPELSISIHALLEACLVTPFHIFQSGNLLFSILIEKHLNDVQLNLLVAKIQRSFEPIINIEHSAFVVTPVIGAAIQTQVEHSQLIYQQARLALDYSLDNHAPFTMYNSSIAEAVDKQKKLELDVTAAFNNEDLELYLQPIVSLPDQQCVGAEVLLRWPNATTKGIYPNVVVEIINKVGLGKIFTRWLIHSVCRLAGELIHQHQLNVYLTLNIRAEDLYDVELPHLVKQSSEFWKIQPKDIILEITESGILEETETTLSTIQQITENGFKLALDDFGTGYSSMARLRNMPISLIKIDQSFVRNIDRSHEDMKIVESMSMLANSLGKEVLVEGLETFEALALINQMCIKKAQGYYFSKPMPFNEFIVWAKNKRPS